MVEALRLSIGGDAHFYAMGFGVVSLRLQIFIPYKRHVRVLKWLTLALLAYAATVLCYTRRVSRILCKRRLITAEAFFPQTK